jgi:rRNA-processing protein FCF1
MSDRFFNIFIPLKELHEIMDDAYVVIDTNVLLMAYQWRDTTYKVVYDILSEISKQNRLKIPHQVVKEFANNRAEVIQTLYQEIHDKLLSKLEKEKQPQNTIKTVVPAYDMFDNKIFKPILDSEERYLNAINELNTAKKEYKLSLVSDLQKLVKSLLYKDPISEKFKAFFENGYIDEIEIDSQELTEELARRKKHNIPPGYKDNGHKGDYLIWQSILSLKDKPVIFVTGDVKADWAYTRGEDFLGGRRELIEEFFEENNKTLHIITPLQFAEAVSSRKGKALNEDVKEDLRYKQKELDIYKVFNLGFPTTSIRKKYKDQLSQQRKASNNFKKLSNEIEYYYHKDIIEENLYYDLKHGLEVINDDFLTGDINVHDFLYKLDEFKEKLYRSLSN